MNELERLTEAFRACGFRDAESRAMSQLRKLPRDQEAVDLGCPPQDWQETEIEHIAVAPIGGGR